VNQLLAQVGRLLALVKDMTGRLTALEAEPFPQHHDLGGLGDDDHTQYLRADGARAATGTLDMGSQAITNAASFNGEDIPGHIADGAKHREINDAGSGTTDLLSATKIIAIQALKADLAHTHAASDLDSGTLADARVAESNVTQHEAAIDLTALSGFLAAQHRELYFAFLRSTSSAQTLSSASETNLNLQGTKVRLGTEIDVNVSDEITFSSDMDFVFILGLMKAATSAGTRSTPKLRVYRNDATSWGSPLDESDTYLRNQTAGKDGQCISLWCFTDILSTHKLQLRGLLGGSSGTTATKAFGTRALVLGIKA